MTFEQVKTNMSDIEYLFMHENENNLSSYPLKHKRKYRNIVLQSNWNIMKFGFIWKFEVQLNDIQIILELKNNRKYFQILTATLVAFNSQL